MSNDDAAETTHRRRFLKALGAVGVAGLAGCSGDSDSDGTDTGTGTETGTGTDGSMTTATPTPTPTPTATPECSLPNEPGALVSFPNASDGVLTFGPNEERTIEVRINNNFLRPLANGEWTLEAPNDEWEISNPSNNMFETLESTSGQTAEWDVVAPASSDEVELTINAYYEACDGEEQVETTDTQMLAVDQYANREWEELALVHEYYDSVSPDESPGDINDAVGISLDLSGGAADYASAKSFQLRFSDQYPSDGFGARLEDISVVAGGETVHEFSPSDDAEQDYLVNNGGSQLDGSRRYADGSAFWVYQFPIPEGTSDLSVEMTIDNQFIVEGRQGAERSGSDGSGSDGSGSDGSGSDGSE